MTCDLNIDDISRPIELESDDTLAIGPTGEVGVLHIPGPVSSVEIWFDVSFDWLRGCIVRAYGIVGSVRLELAKVDLKTLAPETVDGRGKGLCLTVQGRPASAYEVTVERAAGSPETAGRFFARAWMGMDQAPAVAMGTSRATTGARYGVTSEPMSTGTDEGDWSLAYLFQAGGRTRIEIDRIVVTYFAAATTGSWSIRGARLSAEATEPDGTVEENIEALDGSGATSNAYLVHAATSAPTPVTPDVFCAVLPATAQGTFEWTAEASGGPIVLRPGRSEGFEIRATVGVDELDEDARVTVAFFWREIEDPPVDLAHYGFVHEWRADEGVTEASAQISAWTDRLSGAVLVGATNKPDLGSDDDGPYIDFEKASSERLDADLLVDGAGDYTIVAAVLTDETSGAIAQFYGTTAAVELYYATGPYWVHNIADNSSATAAATVAALRFIWEVVIIRRVGNLIKTRARGVNGTNETVALGAVTLEDLRIGARKTASTSADYVDFRLRHLAIAKRALTDDECVAVEGLMATYWNIR